MKLDDIQLKIIPDSRGKDTLEAYMESEGISVTASVPAGESTGRNEAKLIEPKKALEKIAWIQMQIKDHDFAELSQFDGLLNTLDGTSDKSNLGANLILSLSLCFTKLLAKKNNLETWQLIARISGQKAKLPLCFFNVIEGGVHTKNSLPFQEYWYIPKTYSPKHSLELCFTLLKSLAQKIKESYGEVEMGSEGGYTVPSKDPEEGLRILKETAGEDADFGLDVAASAINSKEPISFYETLINNYPMLAIEDPYPEDDWEDFSKITKDLGDKVWIVGDDLTTTNPQMIKKAAENNAVNAVIIKTTQIGTVTETIQAANLAKSFGWKIIVANRGEETLDDFIADLAVGLGADAIKSGCPLQKERLVKYQRLVEIEETWQN